MNKYESVVIINPNVDEEGIKTLNQKKLTNQEKEDQPMKLRKTKKVTMQYSILKLTHL